MYLYSIMMKNYKICYNKINYITDIYEKDKNSKELTLIYKKNLYISYKVAELFKFEMYETNNNLNNELLKNLCDLYSFEKPIDFIFINNKNINIELNLKTNVNISKLMNNLNTYLSKKINQIDFRPIDKYDYVKKYVRLYENSLNKMLFELGYNINNKKVSRAWIKMY